MSDRDVAVITFLSDYGASDEFVGVCHAVIARRCPAGAGSSISATASRATTSAPGRSRSARPSPTRRSGCTWRSSTRASAATRRAVALALGDDGRMMVGPDNGLLTLAAEQLGGVAAAVDIGDSPECLQPISATFHGRDVFAPVAAALASASRSSAGRADRRRPAGRAEPAAAHGATATD